MSSPSAEGSGTYLVGVSTARHLDDVPHILGGVAEFATRNAGRETIIADGDLLVDVLVCEVIGSLGHGSDKNADALLLLQALHILAHADQGGVEAQRILPAIGGEMVRDGVLDDLQELLLRVDRSNRESVQELDHQPSESLEGTWDADRWADFDENPTGGMDVDLEHARLVDRRVEEGEKAL